MSLVHESLVRVLDDRFVNCYWNAFPGAGKDAAASRFAKSCGSNLRYGALATPDGEIVRTFGFDRTGFVRALKTAMRRHPELTRPRPRQAAVLAAADQRPKDPRVQLEAAKVHAYSLAFDEAQARLDAALESCEDRALRGRLLYWKGHVEVLRLPRRSAKKARRLLASIEDLPAELADDVACDLTDLDIELPSEPGFYRGWRFQEGVDLEGVAKRMRDIVDERADSNRRGQAMFYLGLALRGLKKNKEADAVWKRHFVELAEDRFAMLSRIHHTEYVFSPYGGGRGTSIRDPRGRGAVRGGKVRVRTSDGRELEGEEAQKLMDRLMTRKPKKKKRRQKL